jgi:act minimal PKS acyl carrier protein
MAEFTLANLKTALVAAAGQDEAIDLDGDIMDMEFSELGYDSLAILETASHVERGFNMRLPEDAVGTKQTPRAFIDFVNSILHEGG